MIENNATTVVVGEAVVDTGKVADGEEQQERPAGVRVVGAGSFLLRGNEGEYVPTKWELFLASSSCACCCPQLAPCIPSCATAKCKVCSWCSCCTFFGIGWLFFLILIMKISAAGDAVFETEEQQLKNDDDVRNYWGFKAAQTYSIQGCGAKTHEEKSVCEADAKCQWNEEGGGGKRGGSGGECEDKQVCPAPAPREKEEYMAFIFFIYEATGKDGNLLDDDILSHIAAFEKDVGTTVNGAKEPWTDWCKRTYAGSPTDTAKWTCSPPSSLMNIFGINAASRAKIKELAQTDGYTSVGALNCICTTADELCSICNADGTLKGYSAGVWDLSQLPSGHCFRSASCSRRLGDADDDYMNISARTAEDDSHITGRRLSEAPSPTPVPEFCSRQGGAPCVHHMGEYFNSLCKDKPSCQWTGPGLSFTCSSTGFYFPQDQSGALLSGAEKDAAVSKMCNEDLKMYVGFRKSVFDTKFDCTAKKVKYARSMFMAGGKKTDANMKDIEDNYFGGQTGWFARETLLEQKVEKDSEGKLRIMLFAEPLLRNQFMQLLLIDSSLSAGALIAVWLYMWYALESFFLASCGMFEILFSLPVAMSLWAVFLNQKINFLQMLVIYMILGIGADDVFIVNDAWQQSRFAGPEITGHWVTRFSWAYRRSFCAMAVTTATTCGSFIIGAVSPLPQVRDFCIFAGVVVFVDWIFCITFFASALIVYEKNFKGIGCGARALGCPETREPGTCLSPGMCWGCCRAMCSFGGTCWSCIPKPPGENDAIEPRALEKFCEGPLHGFLAGIGGKVVIGIWTVLVIGSLVLCGLELRTAEKAPPIGRDSVDMTYGLEVLMNEFPNFRQPRSYAVWGLDAEMPVKYGDKSADNEPKYRSGGATELTSPDGQKTLLKLCRAADLGKDSKKTRCESNECIVGGDAKAQECTKSDQIWQKHGVWSPADTACQPGRYCFMEEFARWWAWTVDDCSSKATQQLCTAQAACQWSSLVGGCYPTKTEHDYPGLAEAEFLSKLSGSGFKAYLETRSEVLAQYGREYDVTLYNENTGFSMLDGNTGIKFAYIGWNATYAFQNTVDVANDWYDRWQGFFSDHASGIKGFQTMELYTFRATQNEMVKGAVLGIVMSLIVAFVVMLSATGNWWTTSIGLVNIMAIVALILGWMPLLGWSLGEYECIFMIATVGLSVDYTVHLLHAYNHVTAFDRLTKAKGAMAEMGVSVVSSAVTTLLAASLLFACRFYFFFQFGAFIFIVILVSILMSLTFLMPLIMIIGPEGDQGSLRRCKAAPEEKTDKE